MPSDGNPDPTTPATVEVGFTDADTSEYTALADGDTMPLFTALQGGSHIFTTLRAEGFTPRDDGRVRVELVERVRVVATNELVHDLTTTAILSPIGDDVFEGASIFMFLNALPEDLDGQLVAVEFTLTAEDDDDRSAMIQQTLRLELQ